MIFTPTAQAYSLSRMQDACEQRIEPYINTAREQSQQATQQPTKRAGFSAGFAGTEAGTAGRL
jgi:hypothetical protein